MPDQPKTNELPSHSKDDDAHLATRTGLALIPGVGGAAVELFNRLCVPPIERRRVAWLEGLADRVSALEQAGYVSMEDLQNNEAFSSALLQATHVAIRNHQQVKIDALRNAVLNSAIGLNADDATTEMFLALIDDLTVSHIQVLRTLHDADLDNSKRHKVEISVKTITDKVLKLLPALRDSRPLVESVVDDLCRRRLLFWSSGIPTISADATQLTSLGRDFMAFIDEPRLSDSEHSGDSSGRS